MATHNQGFTLIELIVVIVLLGIIGTFSFSYLGFGAKIFSDSVGRDQLLNQSRFAVERLSRELRNALPRSVRVVNDSEGGTNYSCIEFVPIITSSSYMQLPRPGASAGNNFIGVTPLTEPGQAMIGSHLFVYATTPELIYASSERRKIISTMQNDASNTGLSIFTFTESKATFPTGSPARRFFITEQPVSWCVSSTGRLERFEQYGFLTNQPSRNALLANVSFEIMAQQLQNNLADPSQSPFHVLPPTLQRNSLVQFDFRFGRSNNTDPLRIQHEVFVPNVP